jgi:hypothetical protein
LGLRSSRDTERKNDESYDQPAEEHRLPMLSSRHVSDPHLAKLQQAIELHRAGRFDDAERIFEAFAFGVPVVTLPSRFLWGRITLELYKMMGLDDCVARDADDYVNIASELGGDPEKRAAMRSEI